MTTCREFFYIYWTALGEGRGSTQSVSLTAFSHFFLTPSLTWFISYLLQEKLVQTAMPNWRSGLVIRKHCRPSICTVFARGPCLFIITLTDERNADWNWGKGRGSITNYAGGGKVGRIHVTIMMPRNNKMICNDHLYDWFNLIYLIDVLPVCSSKYISMGSIWWHSLQTELALPSTQCLCAGCD